MGGVLRLLVAEESLDGFDALNLRNLLLEDTLNAVGKCHLRHGTAGARADQPDLHDAAFNIDELDIATIGLQCGPDSVEYLLHALFHRNSLRASPWNQGDSQTL